ncbi:hypothetical protein F4861DRAFT_508767 [Xylaria intraflava]|nr:hypothetical protein F4861DRAFT_508767 [Xylaria intraflava]
MVSIGFFCFLLLVVTTVNLPEAMVFEIMIFVLLEYVRLLQVRADANDDWEILCYVVAFLLCLAIVLALVVSSLEAPFLLNWFRLAS